MAFAVMGLIMSVAVVLSFEALDISEKEYKNKYLNEENTSYEHFEAWLEYSIIADGFDIGNNDGFEEGNVTLCDYNLSKLEKIKASRDEARRMILLSMLLLIVSFVGVHKRRMYEGVLWGGIAACVVSALCIGTILIHDAGALLGVRDAIFKDDFSLFFSGEDRLISLIPDGMGMRVFAVYVGTILAGLVVTIIVRLVSWRKSQPHNY
jgi:uncharacterized membrane protein